MKDKQLQTERLLLRLVSLADLGNVHALHCLPETDEFNTLGIPQNTSETKAIIKIWMAEHKQPVNPAYIFVVELKDSNTFTGIIGIRPGKPKYRNAEVWFKFHRDFWNKGYATEALKKLIDFGFSEMKLHRIEAGCATGNTGSYKVMEKAGMQREAHTRQLLPLKSGWSDHYGYAILSTDNR